MHASTAPALRSRLLWQGYAAVAFALGVAYFFLHSGSDAQLLIYQLLAIAAPIAIVVGVRRYRPALYRHWLLFAGGLALWAVGTVQSAEGEGATFRVALPSAASITTEPIKAAA